jgi:hypothetical protein
MGGTNLEELEDCLVIGEAGNNGGVGSTGLLEDLGNEVLAKDGGADRAAENSEACGDFVRAVRSVVVALAGECIDCALEGGACVAFMAVPRAE